jgi:hypothetical protein
MPFFLAHLLWWSALVLVIDAVLWHLALSWRRGLRVGVRLVLFLSFSLLIVHAARTQPAAGSPSDR